MSKCCENDCHVALLRARQSATLKAVLWINAVMFLVLIAAALYARSSALLSDSLDNLGDALTYGLSLYAVNRAGSTKARVALFKGGLILAAGLFVLAQIAYRLVVPTVPLFEAMGVASLLALASQRHLSCAAVEAPIGRCEHELGLGMFPERHRFECRRAARRWRRMGHGIGMAGYCHRVRARGSVPALRAKSPHRRVSSVGARSGAVA